ncbi:MAG: hypothetical protein ACYTJ0_20525 [Planctomycetota bacterium]|jgi:hypothetical protein
MTHRPNRLLLAAMALLLPSAAPARPAVAQDTRPATRPGTVGSTADAAGVGYLVRRIEKAHGAEAWRRQEVVRADLHVHFGGEDMLQGTLAYDIHGGRARLDLRDGTALVFDGTAAWVAPSSAETSMARFHLLTWPYFLAAPFKLRDPGTVARKHPLSAIDGRLCETLKLTFAAGTGDTPDDWYLVHLDTTTDLVAAMAYIVTYGTPVAEASADPHAIVYGGHRTIDGVVVPTEWTFRSWRADDGVQGDELGRARLRNVRFGALDESLFAKPADAREDKLPG